MFLEIFDYDFMNRALVVGCFTAVATAMLGNFIVAARQAIVSDMLAHTALVGVGLGIFWQLSPTHLALVTTIVASLLLWWLSRQKHQAPEAISMVLLTGGLAIALLLTHFNKNNPVSLDTYLFGSVLTITPSEMYQFIGVSLGIIITLLWYWRPFMTLVFDANYQQTQKHPRFYEVLFMLLIALIVGVGLKVIGGLLIGALLVIPVLVAQTFARGFRQNVVISIVINVIAVLGGIVLSFYIDMPSSSSIVLSLITMYSVAKLKQIIWT